MTTKQKIRFSVVVPCYNEEATIAQTLKSLFDQDFKGSYEVIVVDNNCVDKTVEIASKFDVRIVKEICPGVCPARQAGTQVAWGEIIISTDADTTFAKDWLSKIDAEYKRATPGVVAICGPCSFVNAPWWGTAYSKLLFSFIYRYYKIFGRTIYISAANTSFKKEFWDGYDTRLTQGGDEIALLHKLRGHGKVVTTLGYTVYTSSRRLEHGLFYNLFVTCFYYYFLAYYLDRIFGRQIIGSAPAFRNFATNAGSIIKERSRKIPLINFEQAMQLFNSSNLRKYRREK